MKKLIEKYLTLKFGVALALGVIALVEALGLAPTWLPVVEAVLKILGAFA